MGDERIHSKRQELGAPSSLESIGGFCSLVGNTPLVRLSSLSELSGCEILGKCEFQQPGGSVKDRAARFMIEGLEAKGLLVPGKSCLVEATAGNTGIALALVGLQRKYKCVFCYPDYVSEEKLSVLRTLGAELVKCPAVPGSDPRHFQETAKRIAKERDNCVYVAQFDSEDNARAHYETTGPEIFEQTKGKVDGFIAATGTGGTLAGTSRYLKETKPSCKIYTLDTPGQGVVFEKEVDNSAFGMSVRMRQDHEKSKGTIATEGIGSGRLYENIYQASRNLDGVLAFDDPSVISCAHFLLQRDGLFLGGSAAANALGAFLLAKKLGPGHVIVTILCDGGQRSSTKVYNDEWLEKSGFSSRCGCEESEDFLARSLALNGLQ